MAGSKLIRADRIVKGMKLYLDYVLGPKKTALEKQIFDVWFERAFYNPLDYIDGSGEFKYPDGVLPEGLSYQPIEGIETRCYGKDGDKEKVTVKLANRQEALSSLDKIIGLTRERVEETMVVRVSKETEDRLSSIFSEAVNK